MFQAEPNVYHIVHLSEVDSTNNYIKLNWKNLPNRTVVLADFQTKGSGQFERSWVSNKKENLLYSILIKENVIIDIELLNQIVIDMVIKTLDQFGIRANFKTPNDIYVSDKKIAGILIERQFDQYQLLYTIIGIGLNVNQVVFEGLNATSMHNESKKKFTIEHILDTMLKIFDTLVRI